MSDYLCNDCLDTGWIEDREGKTVCACISETEPYQLLRAELDALKPDAERWRYARRNLAPAECVVHGWPDLFCGSIDGDEGIAKLLDRMADAALRGEGEK